MTSRYKLPDDLYAFQKEDSDRMATNKSWLNFSEMGVGKTPETLNTIKSVKPNFPLIVCPNSLRLEWARQIEDWTDESWATTTGMAATRLGPIIRTITRKDGAKYRIINYEALRNQNNLDILNLIPFDLIVFDEIHKLRNPKTKLVKAVWDFLEAHQDAKILGLTGSPIMNYPNDLYVPLTVAFPDKYSPSIGSWRQFMYSYTLWSSGRFGPYIYGTRQMTKLREETSKLNIIRRTKKEVLPFLPEKYYRRVLLEMKPDQRKLYNAMENDLKILLDTGEPLYAPSVLAAITRLRQINLDPKILAITISSAKTQFIYDLLESTEDKIVMYSTFEGYIYLLHLILEAQQIRHVMITGQVPREKRADAVYQFQNDPSIRICLGTIQTMGEGITLTAASNVVLLDRWWNEPSNQQAIDRLHRIGQKSAVQVIYPIVKNSIDASLDEILARKNEASQQYYGDRQVTQMIIDDLTGGPK